MEGEGIVTAVVAREEVVIEGAMTIEDEMIEGEGVMDVMEGEMIGAE